jgi:DNA repair protein RadC
MKGGSYLKIEIVDHIIISENNYFSLADTGFFESQKIKKEL